MNLHKVRTSSGDEHHSNKLREASVQKNKTQSGAPLALPSVDVSQALKITKKHWFIIVRLTFI